MADAIAVLKQQGAIVVDPADVPSFVAKDPQKNFPLWDFCSGAEHAKGKDANCSINFKYGMKRDFNSWLKTLGTVGAGEDADGAAAVEPGAREGRRDPFRTVAPRHLGRDGSRRPTARGSTPTMRKDNALSRDAGHRRRAESAQARRDHSRPADPAPGSPPAPATRSSPCRSALVPNAPHAGVSRRLQREARAVRRRLRRRAVQRAEADRARVRVRAGDEEASSSAGHTLNSGVAND